jgi:DNA replication protein DnaC
MILLTGGAGAGKTTLAAAILHDVCDRALAGDRAAGELAWTAIWAAAPSLARARREHRLGGGEAPEVRRALEASLLVVDDLGTEREDRDGALAEVVYERHAREAPTVITTGASYKTLVGRYGDGIARRLTEQPGSAIVRCAARTAEGQTELALVGGSDAR